MADSEDILSDESQAESQRVLFSDLRERVFPLPAEWPDGLHFLIGSRNRLDGLIIYHDFRWIEVFPHNKKMFVQGQVLAKLVRKSCPSDKTPVLLLTTRKDVKAGIRIAGDEYIAVVNITDYLNQTSNHAESYFIGNLKGDGQSVFDAMRAVEQHPVELQSFVTKHVTSDAITDWVAEDPSRLEQLTTIIHKCQANPVNVNAFELLLRQFSEERITEEQATTVAKLLAGQSQIGCLVSALAEKVEDLKRLPSLGHEDSRRMVAAALRASHRADAIEELKRLIAEDALEPAFQNLLDANWWMLGTQYVERVQHRHLTVDENVDILLRSACGFFDLVELKRSKEHIFREDHGKFIVASSVNLAVNQTGHYIAEIEATRSDIKRRKRVDLFKINAIVIIGNVESDDEDAESKREALRMYNSHLHRIRVITYDELVTIAEQVVCANEGEIQYAAGVDPSAIADCDANEPLEAGPSSLSSSS